MEGLVIAAPMNELAVRNAKYAGECTELHLGGKGLTALHDVTEERKNDFEQFVSLEVLWINNNRLTRIEGLDANFRCKVLYAHNNKIASLRNSSISSMTFLNTLTLADNQLSDFMGTLEVLRRQNHLRVLDMSGNPVAEEKDYRLHVVQQLKGLEVIDKHKVTVEERAAAAKIKPLSTQIDLMGGSNSNSNGNGGGQQAQEGTAAAVTAVGGGGAPPGGGETVATNQGTLAATQAANETSTSAAAVAAATDGGAVAASATIIAGPGDATSTAAAAAAGASASETAAATKAGRAAAVLVLMRRHVADKRVCLKPMFQALDPRNEMVVRDDVAVTLLHTYQLWPMPAVDDIDANGGKVIPGPEKWPSAGGSEDENLTLDQEALLARYAAPTPVRCKLLGRDPQAVLGHRFIDYVKLCHDLEPKAGGRDMDDLERRMAVEWKQHAPEKSVVTRLLEKEVHAYQRRVRADEEALRLAMGGVTTKSSHNNPDDGLDETTNLKKKKGVGENGNTTGFEPQDLHAAQLSPWELHTLKGFFESAERKLAEFKRDKSSSAAATAESAAEGADAAPAPAATLPLTGLLPRPELVKCLEQTTLLGRAFLMPSGRATASATAARSPGASPPSSPKSSFGGAAGSPRSGAGAASPSRPSSPLPSAPSAAAPVSDGETLEVPGAAGRHAIYERVFKAMDMAEAAKGKSGTGAAGSSRDALLSGPEGTSWKAFLSAVVDGIKDNVTGLELLPPLQWTALPYQDLKDKADRLFAEAAALQRRVMTSSKESPADLKTIGGLSSCATRLHKLQLAHGPRQVLSPTSEARASAEATARAAADEAAVAKAEEAALSAAAESSNKDGSGSASSGFTKGAVGSLMAVGKFKKMSSAADERDRGAAHGEDLSSGGSKLPPLDNPPVPPSPGTLRARKLDKLRRKFRLSTAEAESMLGPAL